MQSMPTELSPEQRQELREFLDHHPIGVLATVDLNGNPHASTIYFSADDELNIRFTTKQDTHKHMNIQQHGTIMLAVYDAGSQTAVQLSGTAQLVNDAQAAHEIYQGTLKAAGQTGADNVPPIAKIAAGPYVAYQVAPTNIWMTEYGWGDNFAKALEHADDPEASGDPA